MVQKKQEVKTARDVATDVVSTVVEVLATGGLTSILKAGAQAGIKQSFKKGVKAGVKTTISSVDKQGLKHVGKEMLLEGAQKMDDENDNNMGDILMTATRGGRRGR